MTILLFTLWLASTMTDGQENRRWAWSFCSLSLFRYQRLARLIKHVRRKRPVGEQHVELRFLDWRIIPEIVHCRRQIEYPSENTKTLCSTISERCICKPRATWSEFFQLKVGLFLAISCTAGPVQSIKGHLLVPVEDWNYPARWILTPFKPSCVKHP